MYEYREGIMNVTIILGRVTAVYYSEDADTFEVYLTDNDEPNPIPAKFYDDFMRKLALYVKSQEN